VASALLLSALVVKDLSWLPRPTGRDCRRSNTASQVGLEVCACGKGGGG
jgi:hypothetical protein